MRQSERWNDIQQALRATLKGRQATMWTALPGVVASVGTLNGQITISVTPAVQAGLQGPTAQSYVTLPTIPDVPVVFSRGGGYTLTFPVAVGDECLLVFASRNIDNWWQQGGVQRPFNMRMHDLSDAFAIVGPFSQATKITPISTTTVQLRSNDGTQYVEIDTPNKKINIVNGNTTMVFDNAAGQITLNAPTQINLTTPIVNISGVLDVQGIGAGSGAVGTINGTLRVTGEVIGGYGTTDISLTVHVHSNSGGTGDGGPPVSGT